MARYFAEFGQVPERPGEVCYLAVAAIEPAGKPLRLCRKVEVGLELVAPEDLEAAEHGGVSAMRRRCLLRLTRQARVQGALLAIEDLAYLVRSVENAETRRQSHPYHKAVYEAVANGQVEQAQEAARHHLVVGAETYGDDYEEPLDAMAHRSLERILGPSADLDALLESTLPQALKPS